MTKLNQSSTKVVCPFCKRKGHISTKSSKCKLFKPLTTKVKRGKKGLQSTSPLSSKSSNDIDDVAHDWKHDNLVDTEVNTTKFVLIKVLKSCSSAYVPVVDVDNPTFIPGDTIFQIPGFKNCDDESNPNLSPTPAVFISNFFPIELINKIVVNSTKYIKKQG